MKPAILSRSSVSVFPRWHDFAFQGKRDSEASGRLRAFAVLPDHHRVALKSKVSILSGLPRGRFWKKKKEEEKTISILCTLRAKTLNEVFMYWYELWYLYCQTWRCSFQCLLDPGSGFCALCFHLHNKVLFLAFLPPETHSAPSLLQFSMREGRYHRSNDGGLVLS